MKFGVRECCDVSFKALDDVTIGKAHFKKGQPVLLIDTATTSTVEGAATTVYAQGGKGNTRLLAWEGEKTLTFTVEDALLSPVGFGILSGAGLFGGGADYKTTGDASTAKVHVHRTTRASVTSGTSIDISNALATGETICTTAPIYIVEVEDDGSIKPIEPLTASNVTAAGVITLSSATTATKVMVDYYVIKDAADVYELAIDAENFAGYYYVEASTLFRKESTGKDLPAEITIPKVKIQSNFTFTMSSTGDPSTFSFTMDAMPGYTYFNPNDEVLMVMQIIDAEESSATYGGPYMIHESGETNKYGTADGAAADVDSYNTTP